MALDERERLKDGVVDPRSDLCPLLEPDALHALAAELPEPGAEDEEERARHRARADERPRRPDVAEDGDRSGHHQRDREDGQRAALPDRAATGEHDGEPGDDQTAAEDDRAGEAEREQQRDRGRRDDRRSLP